MIIRLLTTLAVTAPGGLLFAWLHLPLSWMLGPLTAAVLWQSLTAGKARPLVWPVACRNGGLLLLGYAMGLAFTADSARQIAAQLPAMAAATLLTVGFSMLAGYWLARRAGISPQSGIIGSVPGGLSQMVLVSEETPGADGTVVAFMQTIRLLTVIFAVPFLAVHGLAGPAGSVSAVPLPAPGAAAAHPFGLTAAVVLVPLAALGAVRLKLPTPWFLGPMLASALLTIAGLAPPHLPAPLLLAAQLSLGIYLGLGIKLSGLAGWRRLLPYSLLTGAGLVVFSFGLSWVYSKLLPMSMATAFLSTSPGGMTEMGVVASVIGADVSLVVAFQMFRILFILFAVPYLLRWGFRRAATRKRQGASAQPEPPAP
ncbi:AbrB family transcriptional regulator [Paenibacillus sp. S-38]|uniref:AbrB family transcriptional regulator n=1 Tax=Paenibacillus sp. S-38 TaxID=3416710 RepID=UPI003CF94F81